MLIEYDGLRRPVAFHDADPVHRHLAAVLKGWRWREVDRADAEPVITVERIGDSYRLGAPWLEEPIDEPSSVSAVCSVVVDLVRAFLDERPDLLCLHCGAVEIGGRLVVFPSTSRAGKSTLIARLATAGFPVFTDDLLPLTGNGLGMALGVAPRLRWPLPAHASGSFRRYVDDHAGPDDGYYRYVLPQAAAWPEHGRTAPLGAVVLLDRQPDGPAHIAAAPKGRALTQLIVQNVARSGHGTAIIDRLHGMLRDMPCMTLTYSELEQPVELLERMFADREAVAAGPRSTPAVRSRDITGLDHPPAPIDGRRLERHPEVGLRSVEGELFLVDPAGEGIFHLDAIASGLWTLMEQPVSAREAVDVFAAAFPETGRPTLEHDVGALIGAMIGGGLIRPSGTG